MMDLVIKGWQRGVKTISLVDALRKYKGIGLKQAKQEVDGLLAGESIHLSNMDALTIASARAELEALGCICG
jgi:ribosomal protein L7/L12